MGYTYKLHLWQLTTTNVVYKETPMKLSEFELDVMQRFWDEGACSASAIHKWITEDKNVAYTTVKTIVDRLEEKGAIQRERIEGRSIVYSAAIKKKLSQKNYYLILSDVFFKVILGI